MHVSVCSDGLSSVHTVLKAGVSSWILSPVLTTGGFLCFFLFVCSWVTGGGGGVTKYARGPYFLQFYLTLPYSTLGVHLFIPELFPAPDGSPEG